MPRRPRVATLGARLAIAELRTAQPAKKGTDPELLTQEHRAWRAIVIARAGGRCEWIKNDRSRCLRCEADGSTMYADHIKERADGGALYDPNNGQCLCATHHTIKTNQVRAARFALLNGDGAFHPQGLKPSRIPLTIVCGPPASGKSTYVSERKGPNDLVIDLDMIASRIACSRPHEWDRLRFLHVALAQRNGMLLTLADEGCAWPAAWFIIGEAKAEWRSWWQQALQPIAVAVCETPEQLCLDRIARDEERALRCADASEAVMRWWNEYTPRTGEALIRPTAGDG